MQFDEPPLQGRFLRRYKRFFADVELEDGSTLTAHCPNTGSLLGCKVEGSRVLLRDSGNPARKLRYTWQAIEIDGTWINVDTALPNRLVAEAIDAKEVPALRGYAELKREVKYGTGSRIDILLTKRTGERCYIEVKSTTLAEDGCAMFPDAVTERGRKHLGELAEVVRNGDRAVQFFLIGRDDVRSFRSADHIDPAYGAALREAIEAGVEVLVYTTRVTEREFALGRRIRFLKAPALRTSGS